MSRLKMIDTHDASDQQQESLEQVMYETADPIFSKVELFGFTRRV